MAALIAFALATTLAAQAASKAAPCPGETTIELDQCFSERLAKANADLARYVAAARHRLKQEAATAAPDDKSAQSAGRDFDAAEKAWSSYRDAECGAIYDYWSTGSIRNVESLTCQISLTELHTHTVWLNWLTYMDSTPPILPEPPAAPSE